MNSFLLENHHQLAWNEYGASGGEPVLYFHGLPGSRVEARPADSIARDLGIRLIAPDRPGYGGSDPQDGYHLLDWPDAISQLADRLNIGKFSILGYSGGGPYAMACAHEIGDRIKRLSLVSSPAPFNTTVMQQYFNLDFKPLYELAVTDSYAALQQVSLLASTPEALLDLMRSQLPSSDSTIFTQESFQNQYLENLSLAIHKGVKGIVGDLYCLASPWQFSIENIDTPVDIWHGHEDRNCGFPIGEYLAETIHDTSTHFLDSKGHFYIFEKWSDVLENIKGKSS